MYDYPTVTIEQPLYVRLCITYMLIWITMHQVRTVTKVIFAHVNAPNPTGTLVDAIGQATLRLLAEVDLPNNARFFGAFDPDHGSRVDGESLLQLS